MKTRLLAFAVIVSVLAAACQPSLAGEERQPPVPVTVTARVPLRPAEPCSGRFVPHDLDHVTTIRGAEVTMFDSNGAGLAVNDLDNDGYLDIVLANLAGPNAIFWNKGGLHFKKEALAHGSSRAVTIVDVDADGRQDILFSRQLSAPTFWRNEGERQFRQVFLPGITRHAYALNWADLDGDNDLDLVTASYDAALLKDLGDNFMLGDGAGVFYYENRGETFAPTRLSMTSQALAVFFPDVNGDGRPDILIGNDFAVPDFLWVAGEQGWEPTELFATTTHSTMGFDAGDIDNDGRWELVATDMKPYREDPETLAAWQPVMDMMMHGEVEGDPQIMENVLQVQDGRGSFENRAEAFGVAATGWSWSSKFGDLDQDGFLDLYVVNGMAAAELFSALPGQELVEENQVLRNENGRAFTPVPTWGLNAFQGGRGMSMADLDQDGDLDIVINNLRAPARIYENQLCGGASLLVDLFWPESGNTRALGAVVTLRTNQATLQRDVRALSGYLSGDPARLHFGLPDNAIPQTLEITWPDGRQSVIGDLSNDTLLQITRNNARQD